MKNTLELDQSLLINSKCGQTYTKELNIRKKTKKNEQN